MYKSQLKLCVYILMLILPWTSQAQQLKCMQSLSAQMCPVCICPSTSVEYNCTLTVPSFFIQWKLPRGTYPQNNDLCIIPRVLQCQDPQVVAMARCGMFTVTLKYSVTCLISTLTVLVPENVNDTIKCESATPNGTILESISIPIIGVTTSQVVIQNITSTNDSLMVTWQPLSTSLCSKTDNYTLTTSGLVVTVDSGTTNFTFHHLTPNELYTVQVFPNSCSGPGAMVTRVVYTLANPPDECFINLIYGNTSLVQLEIFWSRNVSSSVRGFIVRICSIDEGCIEIHTPTDQWYLVHNVGVATVPSYYVGVSSLNQGGAGPERVLNQTVDGVPSIDIKKLSNTTIKCSFLNNQSFYCLVCCSTDSSVPPDTTVHNTSTNRGTEVTVDLNNLTTSQQYYCKASATNIRSTQCGSPVVGGMKVYLKLTMNHDSPPTSKASESSMTNEVYFSLVTAVLPVLTVIIVAAIFCTYKKNHRVSSTTVTPSIYDVTIQANHKIANNEAMTHHSLYSELNEVTNPMTTDIYSISFKKVQKSEVKKSISKFSHHSMNQAISIQLGETHAEDAYSEVTMKETKQKSY